MTGVNVENLEELTYDEEDVVESAAWFAHEDAINCVTYIPDLKLIATCAFDQHVYMYDVSGDKN